MPGATTDDLDPQLVAGLLARVREQHPRVFADRDGIDVLLDLQVLRHDDSDESEVGGILRPTLAGLLALGRYPQKFYPRLGISIAVFPGTSRDDVFRGDERLVASKSVVGSIPVMIRRCGRLVDALDWREEARLSATRVARGDCERAHPP